MEQLSGSQKGSKPREKNNLQLFETTKQKTPTNPIPFQRPRLATQIEKYEKQTAKRTIKIDPKCLHWSPKDWSKRAKW